MGRRRERIEVTLQMLLVTAALYLVIGQIIPFVGYLTVMDNFVTTIYICLAAVTGINFLYLQLELKQDSRPMNLFYRTLLITFLRVVWIPVAIILYVAFFEIETPAMYTLLALICVIMAIYGVWRIDVIFESFEYSVRNLRAKAQYVETQFAMICKDQGIYGEKLVKQISLTSSEKWILTNCQLYFLDPPTTHKYAINFAKLFGPIVEKLRNSNNDPKENNHHNNNSSFSYDDFLTQEQKIAGDNYVTTKSGAVVENPLQHNGLTVFELQPMTSNKLSEIQDK